MKIKAPAKINIFLKIVGKRGGYHELFSRFIRYEDLSDEISFEPKSKDCELEVDGEFDCLAEQNTITKAYYVLKQAGYAGELREFFANHKVSVQKHIPTFAGLGGGSSDGASFMLMCNEVLNLNISQEELARLGAKVGADVPFFIYGYKSANVRGIGEIVEEFEDDLPALELKTTGIKSSTPKVFREFSKDFKGVDGGYFDAWENCSSRELLAVFKPDILNDLFLSAIRCNEELGKYYDEGYFMSGSGSSMFKVKYG